MYTTCALDAKMLGPLEDAAYEDSLINDSGIAAEVASLGCPPEVEIDRDANVRWNELPKINRQINR